MRRLVVNADDAGFAESTDAAILRCVSEGVVTSVSVVANGPTTERFVERALAAGIDLGLHFNLTQGSALAGPHRTLTDAGGRFAGDKHVMWARARRDALDADEVRAEAQAQWDRVCALGVRPTHVDGHNHVHLFPAAREALRTLATGLWGRMPVGGPRPESFPEELETWAEAWRHEGVRCTDAYAGLAFAHDPREPVFLARLPEDADTVEYMVHPGARPGSAFASSPDRDAETAVLCAAGLAERIAERGYRLVSFAEL